MKYLTNTTTGTEHFHSSPQLSVNDIKTAKQLQLEWTELRDSAISQESTVVNKKSLSDTKNKPFVAHNSGDCEWYTPACFVESARTVMGNIDLDPASCEYANRTVKAAHYYTKEDNGLLRPWYGNIWLNPPFSQVSAFVDKLYDSDFKQAIVLTNNCTETKWFSKLLSDARAILFPNHRIRFEKPGVKPTPPMQGQAIVYLGPDPIKFLREFDQYGTGRFLEPLLSEEELTQLLGDSLSTRR